MRAKAVGGATWMYLGPTYQIIFCANIMVVLFAGPKGKRKDTKKQVQVQKATWPDYDDVAFD